MDTKYPILVVKNRKDTICGGCRDRAKCRRLCDEAERYANQDNIDRRERLILDNNLIPGTWPKLSTIETILLLFFTDRHDVPEIADKLMVSRQYVYRIIKQFKPIIAANIKKSVESRR